MVIFFTMVTILNFI